MIEHREEPWSGKLWSELARLDPGEVCRRTGARLEPPGAWRLPFLEREYRIDPAGRRIEEAAAGPPGAPAAAGGEPDDPDLRLLLLHYLAAGRWIPPSGRRVSEKELKGGAAFFRSTHALPSAELARRFATDARGFLEAGRKLGGRPAGYGDAALEWITLPEMPLTCVLWVADEEFPARVGYLFDPVTDARLPLDVIFALTQAVVRRLLRAAGPPPGGSR